MEFIKKYIVLFALIASYVVIMVSVIDFGIPNPSHPFTYHMDEWHQLMAVRSLFSQGSSNVLGAANGPVFFFLLSGLYLGPLYILQLVDPFVIKSSISSLSQQQQLFEALRFTTILYGIGAIILMWEISRRYLKINSIIVTAFFIFTPIWIMLSNYFKYDIALVFWMLVSLLFIYRFAQKTERKRFIVAGVPIGLAFATKISVLPLVITYILAYVMFMPTAKRTIRDVFYGGVVVITTFMLMGIPDIFFRAKEYYDFFYLNIISGPDTTANYILHLPVWVYVSSGIYPLLFGHPFYFLFLASFTYFFYLFIIKKKIKKEKEKFLILATLLLFIISLLPLKILATGNRALVLLPFMAFVIGMFYERLMRTKKHIYNKIWMLLFLIAFVGQIVIVFAWLQMKYSHIPQEEASVWMLNTLSPQTIGIENIPIYQSIPDIALKEFYTLQQDPKAKTRFTYSVIDEKAVQLPKTVIITNTDFEMHMLKDSSKKRLLKRLEKERYHEVKRFSPYGPLYQRFASAKDLTLTSIIPILPVSVYQK